IKDTLPTIGDRLRQHFKPKDLFVTHGLKLAITFTLASGLSLLHWDHSKSLHAYWIPLTVAWICKPDLGGTISKVGMRMVGSALGVVLAVFTLKWIGTDDGIILMTALGALLTVAFLWANYTLTVIGITMVVLCLGALTGSPVEDEAWVRMWATLVGGLLVVVTSFIRPVRNGTAATGHLTRVCTELRGYADALQRGMHGDELRQIRLTLLQARTVASATLDAASVEPAGLAKKDSIRINVRDARVILHELEAWLSNLAHVDITAVTLAADASIWKDLETSITAIERRIANLHRLA
ncbi:MAG: FUSC family protein, partial [Burkholderiales bacterium]